MFALDSNILIYAFDESEGKRYEIAKELLEDGFRGNITYFIPLQVLSEFYFRATISKSKAGREAIAQTIKYILEMPNFIVEKIDESTMLDAMILHDKYRIHYWDALILATMKTKFISNIYTEDTKGFDLPWINAVNPFSK